METQSYTYIIIGGGLTGANAVDGIRELDTDNSILLVSSEQHLPYDRPPLTKKLWGGKKKVESIFLHDQQFYTENGVTTVLGESITQIDAASKIVSDTKGREYRYEKLLLATGGTPRRLPIEGGDLPGVCYYRYLDDYLAIRPQAQEGTTAVIIGGGFIGSELAAALNTVKVSVTLISPEPYLVQRVFPEALGTAMQNLYRAKGVTILNNDGAAAISKDGDRFVTTTRRGETLESDILIAGIGILPASDIASEAGLTTENGISVDQFLRSSHPDIYAAGDNAFFPYAALGKSVRIEHWDNAINQGKQAGRNMAGANEPYTYMPFFYSDLFEFGYEAVGDVSSQLETFADWQKENDTGVLYYLRDGKVCGAMMCNVWDKVSIARELIQKAQQVTPEDLRGAIL
jgi:3-phenylpropionate/trans-cinnamate dioxygenase ferredoxin reductase component